MTRVNSGMPTALAIYLRVYFKAQFCIYAWMEEEEKAAR